MRIRRTALHAIAERLESSINDGVIIGTPQPDSDVEDHYTPKICTTLVGSDRVELEGLLERGSTYGSAIKIRITVQKIV